MRKEKHIPIANVEEFKLKLLTWGQRYQVLVWLDSNNYKDNYSRFEAVLAVDAHSVLKSSIGNGFKDLQQFRSKTKDWIFGYLTYDLKNELEDLESNNHDGLNFPAIHFFQPRKLFLFKNEVLTISYLPEVESEIDSDLNDIEETIIPDFQNRDACQDLKIKLRIFKDDYLFRVNKMLDHIKRGDIYEANFCQEFYTENSNLDPLCTYYKLNEISKPPFAAFVRNKTQYLMCASPERYLQKSGNRIISQPIKGTAKRSVDARSDDRLKVQLSQDPKELSENIMIVDMVRNDLSQTAIKGSVEVEELCKVYSFEQVHQMISTVTSKIEANTDPIDVIKTTFPMGSMTGAPKISAMKIIEDLEQTKRGLYSGAVGYFTPNGDFDFNVVIRSILYNADRKYISYSVGSAITAKSDPMKEYEECLIKAKALREVLEEPPNRSVAEAFERK